MVSYIDFYKMNLAWVMIICFNLIYFVGVITILNFLLRKYFLPFNSLIYDKLLKVLEDFKK